MSIKSFFQRTFLFSVLTILFFSSYAWATSQQESVHPLSGRPYSGTMSVAGAAWLDRAEREDEERPDQALEIIGVHSGAVVADIGAGSGYFTLRLSNLVGPTGHVYAVDIQEGMLRIIQRKLERNQISNVSLVLGSQESSGLAEASLDLALMVDVYHELAQPQMLLQQLYLALKPGGRLALLEYRAEDPAIPILPLHKMTVADAKLEIEHEGFKLTTVKSHDLPWQHVLIFTKP